MAITISVSNIGPIRSASVRLRPLTVFIGPNNAGKSVLATVVYAALQKRPGLSPTAISQRLDRLHFLSPPGGDALPAVGKALPWLYRLLAAGFNATRPDALPEDAGESLTDYLKNAFESYAGRLADELERCFGAQLLDLHRVSDSPFQSTALISCDQPSWRIKINVRSESGRLSVDVAPPDVGDVLPAFLGSLTDEDRERIAGIPEKDVVSLVTAGLAWHAFSGLPQRSWYLPAARSGLLQNYRALAGALVRRRTDTENSAHSLPGIVADFLGETVELDERQLGDFPDAARELETRILAGEIRLQHPLLAFGLPEIRYRAGTHDLPLHRTSSMVSELAPVVLYLRHLVHRNDLLLVEEPEAHLHPASQTIFAQIIAGLVNAHIPILLTTHSDYFLDQLNNLIVASRIDSDTALELGIPTSAILSPATVGAYGFTFASPAEGTDVHELKVVPESGVVESSFLHVTESLYDQLVAIDRADQE